MTHTDQVSERVRERRAYYRSWYERNAAERNARRREVYARNAKLRAAIRRRVAAYRAEPREAQTVMAWVDGKRQRMWTTTVLAQELGCTVYTLFALEAAGAIPRPATGGRRLYSARQAELVRKVAALVAASGEPVVRAMQDRRVAAAVRRLLAKW